jgi:hypothetical protein
MAYICTVKKAILLLTLLMLLKPLLPVLEYVVDYEYITTVLCVNKDKPKMQCNGKCHLMKELAKESESEKPLSSDKKITTQKAEVLYLEDFNSFTIISICFLKKSKITTNYSNLYVLLNSATVFHPPIFIS